MSEITITPTMRNNVLTTEHFLKSDDWTIKELDNYAEYCNQAIKCEDCITKENKFLFLKHYRELRGLKKCQK